MQKKYAVGQTADVRIYPLVGKSVTFSGRITKVYVHGAIEVQGTKGDITFILPHEIVAVHAF